MQSFDSRRCHVCQSYRDFIRFSSSSNAPLAAILSRLAFALGDLIPSPMFVSIFVQYALWLKIIGHHEKHLGESSNMYDQIRQGSLLEDHDSKWLATFYHPLAYPSISGSYLARPGVIYTYTYNVCFLFVWENQR